MKDLAQELVILIMFALNPDGSQADRPFIEIPIEEGVAECLKQAEWQNMMFKATSAAATAFCVPQSHSWGSAEKLKEWTAQPWENNI